MYNTATNQNQKRELPPRVMLAISKAQPKTAKDFAELLKNSVDMLSDAEPRFTRLKVTQLDCSPKTESGSVLEMLRIKECMLEIRQDKSLVANAYIKEREGEAVEMDLTLYLGFGASPKSVHYMKYALDYIKSFVEDIYNHQSMKEGLIIAGVSSVQGEYAKLIESLRGV